MRDPRTLWVSPNGYLAVAQIKDVPRGIMRSPNRPSLADLLDSYDWKLRDDGSAEKIATLLCYKVRDDDEADKFLSFFRRTDLPWEAEKKRIPDYPKTCRLCKCPAYLGLNEVEHDPQYTAARGCRGRVDA